MDDLKQWFSISTAVRTPLVLKTCSLTHIKSLKLINVLNLRHKTKYVIIFNSTATLNKFWHVSHPRLEPLTSRQRRYRQNVFNFSYRLTVINFHDVVRGVVTSSVYFQLTDFLLITKRLPQIPTSFCADTLPRTIQLSNSISGADSLPTSWILTC